MAGKGNRGGGAAGNAAEGKDGRNTNSPAAEDAGVSAEGADTGAAAWKNWDIGYDISDDIDYVVQRAVTDGTIPRYLEEVRKGKPSLEEFVSDIIRLQIFLEEDLFNDSPLFSTMHDEYEYIAMTTGYLTEIVELVLWFYECCLMANDRSLLEDTCIYCGSDELYFREAGSGIHYTYIQCGQCKETFNIDERYGDDDAWDDDEDEVLLEDVRKTHLSYVIKAATGYRKGIWRKIQISGAATLDDLSNAILGAFDFDDDHLYAFHMDQKLRTHGVPAFFSPRYGGDGKNAARQMLKNLGFVPKQRFLYEYDFGDEWFFTMTVEKVLDVVTPKAVVIQAKGTSPDQYPDSEDDWGWEEE